MRPEFRDFEPQSGNGASNEIDVSAYGSCGVQIYGTFAVDSVQVQLSFTEAGETFSSVSTLQSGGFVHVPFPAKRIRLLVSGYSSGIVQGAVSYNIAA